MYPPIHCTTILLCSWSIQESVETQASLLISQSFLLLSALHRYQQAEALISNTVHYNTSQMTLLFPFFVPFEPIIQSAVQPNRNKDVTVNSYLKPFHDAASVDAQVTAKLLGYCCPLGTPELSSVCAGCCSRWENLPLSFQYIFYIE